MNTIHLRWRSRSAYAGHQRKLMNIRSLRTVSLVFPLVIMHGVSDQQRLIGQTRKHDCNGAIWHKLSGRIIVSNEHGEGVYGGPVAVALRKIPRERWHPDHLRASKRHCSVFISENGFESNHVAVGVGDVIELANASDEDVSVYFRNQWHFVKARSALEVAMAAPSSFVEQMRHVLLSKPKYRCSVFVNDSPYTVFVDASGRFQIDDVPYGTYDLYAVTAGGALERIDDPGTCARQVSIRSTVELETLRYLAPK